MKAVRIAGALLLLFTGLAFAGGRSERKSVGPVMAPVMAPAGMGGKVLYTTIEDAQALAAKGPTVLFFFADWCPTCQAAIRDIDANEADLGEVTVVIVDYDKEKDLKSRYGITYQHTFVWIDAKGAEIKKWSGGGVAEIVKATKEAM